VGTGGDAVEGPSSLRYAFADPITANLEGAVTFEAPELPEETLMEVGTSRGLVRGKRRGECKESKSRGQAAPCLQPRGLLLKMGQTGFKTPRPVQCSESPGHV